MKSYSFIYETGNDVKEFIDKTPITLDSSSEILVQVFTAVNKYEYIKQLTDDIISFIPNAKIIGATTCGEISNTGMLLDSTVVSLSIFDDTKIITKIVPIQNSSFLTGVSIMTDLYSHIQEKPNAIITFTDGLNTNGEEYLKGISEIDETVTVAGGMAGDNSKFEKTYIFTEETIIDNGAVLAAFYNDDLNVYTNYNFNWKKLGKSHVIEKSEGNRVYQIDGMKPVDFYAEYLGEGIKDFLPAIGIEFPLVIQEDGEDIARAVLSKYDDGSLGFAGNLKEGSIVKFGYGDVSMILKESIKQIDDIHKNPIEGIFIYSCMARKALLKEDVNLEILPLKEVAPVSGLFTYGEFSHSKDKHRLLNQTMTILGFSEGKKELDLQKGLNFKDSLCNINFTEKDLASIRNEALSKLITKTTQELEELNSHLEYRVAEEIKKNTDKDNIMLANARHAQLGEIIGMIAHQWRQPLSAISSTVSAMEVQKDHGMLSDKAFSDTVNRVMDYVDFLNNTIDDFRNFFRQDRQKEYISIENVYEKASVIINTLVSKYDVDIQKNFYYKREIFVNSAELTQVFLIIIKNAIDAMEEKLIEEKKIFIRSFQKDGFCIIEFEDIGGGVPKDILPKIFEKRFTTKGESHGTGIGLDMSKTIIEVKMKGKIEARNGKDGAVFSIYLPILD
jgi:signal transduction histidine kinase